MRVLTRIALACLLSAAAAGPALAAPAAQAVAPSRAAPAVELTVVDLTPKFLAFYDAATQAQATPDARWDMWKRDYDFAAVPPTPEGQALARRMLDAAWPRYPQALAQIRAGAAGLTPDPQQTARAIARLLQPDHVIRVTLAVYVGAFEENAFTAAQGDTIMVAVPVEAASAHRALRMTHEMTHAIHIGMGSFSGGWVRTVGATVLTEGLALRVTERLNPGMSSVELVQGRADWLAEAAAKRTAILKDVQGALDSNRSDDVWRYTIGKGAAGIEREAYYAGWLVVGHWLDQGMTFADIARIPEAQMPARVATAIQQLLDAPVPAHP